MSPTMPFPYSINAGASRGVGNQAVIRLHWSRTSPGIVIQIRRRRGIRGICRRAHVVVAVDLDKRDFPELTLFNEAPFCPTR